MSSLPKATIQAFYTEAMLKHYKYIYTHTHTERERALLYDVRTTIIPPLTMQMLTFIAKHSILPLVTELMKSAIFFSPPCRYVSKICDDSSAPYMTGKRAYTHTHSDNNQVYFKHT